jgi:hypothetical protein
LAPGGFGDAGAGDRAARVAWCTVMNQTILLASFVLLLGACGGKPASTGTGPAAAAAAIPEGNHMCRFIIGGQPWNEHRCQVTGGSLNKLSGWEQFDASFAVRGDTLEVQGNGGSDADRGTPFTMTLTRDGGSWKGTLVPAGATEWWPANSTFEIVNDPGYGGDTYGGN